MDKDYTLEGLSPRDKEIISLVCKTITFVAACFFGVRAVESVMKREYELDITHTKPTGQTLSLSLRPPSSEG